MATLTLVLGVGAAILALVDAALLTPPPFAAPDAMVLVGEAPLDGADRTPRPVSALTLEAWRDRAGASFAALEGFDPVNVTVTGVGGAARVQGIRVTPGFLAALGVPLARGRGFDPEAGPERRVLISDEFWRSRFAGEPAVMGREVVIGGEPFTVLGVLPAGFSFALQPSDLWLPLVIGPGDRRPDQRHVRVLGRLRAGASREQAVSALEAVSARSVPPSRAIVRPIATAIVGSAKQILWLLLAAAGLAIAVAAANLAGLLMLRTFARDREMAVRAALGAGRRRLLIELLLEAHVLVGLGWLGGIMLASWLTPVFTDLMAARFGGIFMAPPALGWRVLAISGAAAVACAWLAGSLGALRAVRVVPMDLLRGRDARPASSRLRHAAIVVQVALSFVLLAALGLMGRSLQRVLAVDAGFDPHGVLTLALSLPQARYPEGDQVTRFYGELQQRLAERLGPGAVTIVDELPLTGGGGRTLVGAAPDGREYDVVRRSVGDGYFDVMRIPLVAGRAFGGVDRTAARTRVVVGQRLADRLGPAQDLVGRQIWLAAREEYAEVVGVAGDVKDRALTDPDQESIYFTAAQDPSRSAHVVARTDLPRSAVRSIVLAEVGRLDPAVPVYNVRSMDEILWMSPGVPARRLVAAAFAGYALLGVALAGVAIFGLMMHEVAHRRRELALRLALGAAPSRLRRTTLAHAGLVVGAGVTLGAPLAALAARGLQVLLFDVAPFDPVAFLAAAAVVALVALAAMAAPVRRVARADPLAVLRSE